MKLNNSMNTLKTSFLKAYQKNTNTYKEVK